jgi:hypothetical protein
MIIGPWTAVLAFLTAIGAGAIIAAVVAHLTTISNFRQAWINALRDDIAEFFKSLQTMNYAVSDYLKDSERNEEKHRVARVAVLFLYERIRLRLNRMEAPHIELERKLRAFLDNPLGQMLADRANIDEAADLARRILKTEWDVAKYPWRGWRFPRRNSN